MMGAGLWIVSWGSVLCAFAWSYIQLRYFARSDLKAKYFWTVFTSWFLGVSALAVLLPADLAMFDESGSAMLAVWKVNYWVTFIWCWGVCPLVMEYSAAGEFEWKGRLLAALRHNAKFYLQLTVALSMFVIFLILTQGFSWGKTSGFLIGAANTYGMVLVVVMLGYGLVEVPREMWNRTDPSRLLKWYYCSVPSLDERLLDAQADLHEVVAQVHELYDSCSGSGDARFEMVLAKSKAASDQCLTDFPTTRYRNRSSDHGANGRGMDSIKQLAALHYQLKQATVRTERADYELHNALEQTALLEEQIAQRNGTSELYQRLDSGASGNMEAEVAGVSASSARGLRSCFGLVQDRLILWKCLTYLLSCFSAILLWNECVSPFSSKVSVFALMLHNVGGEVLRFFLAALPLVYMAACMYTALFKFKLLDSLAIHGNRQSDAQALLANASYLGRLQFSLGVNYVGMLHPQDVKHLAFSSLVGDMTVLPFFGTSFNYYLPLMLVVLAVCTFFKVFDKFLNSIGVETHPDPGRLDDEQSKELIAQGQQIVARIRARQERRATRAGHRMDAEIALEDQSSSTTSTSTRRQQERFPGASFRST